MTDQRPTPDEILALWDNHPYDPTIWPHQTVEALREALAQRDEARQKVESLGDKLATAVEERDQAYAKAKREILTSDRLKFESAIHAVKDLVAAIDSRGPANQQQLSALRNGRASLAACLGPSVLLKTNGSCE